MLASRPVRTSPLSTFTEAYWKIDLHNLLHFLLLRMDSHAQEEIRAYANVIGREIVRQWCPMTWQAFLDYRVNCLTFSSREIALLRLLLASDEETALAQAIHFGWLDADRRAVPRNRERLEAETKLNSLGVRVPWQVGST